MKKPRRHPRPKVPLEAHLGKTFGSMTIVGVAERRTKRGKRLLTAICKCGSTREVQYGNVSRRADVTCGNSCPFNTRRVPDAQLRCVLYVYKTNAADNNRTWNLSFEQFKDLLASPECYWGTGCVRTVRDAEYGNPDFHYFGVDRLDNARGYEPDNVVPCCRLHNFMKRELSPEEFLQGCISTASKYSQSATLPPAYGSQSSTGQQAAACSTLLPLPS